MPDTIWWTTTATYQADTPAGPVRVELRRHRLTRHLKERITYLPGHDHYDR